MGAQKNKTKAQIRSSKNVRSSPASSFLLARDIIFKSSQLISQKSSGKKSH